MLPLSKDGLAVQLWHCHSLRNNCCLSTELLMPLQPQVANVRMIKLWSVTLAVKAMRELDKLDPLQERLPQVLVLDAARLILSSNFW